MIKADSRRNATSRAPRRALGRRLAAGLGALALMGSVLGNLAIFPQAAHAAPGDPFDPADATVFIAQNAPTGLFTARTNGTGDITFTPEGATAEITYNAIAYRAADNYIYALSSSASSTIPASSLVRIGQDGAITRVGTETYAASVVGTFGPEDGYYYTYAAVNGVVSLQVIDVETGAVVRVTPFAGDPLSGVDFAYAEGYFWSLGAGFISRTDPATGISVRWTAPFANPAEDVAGAAWTFGNGNLGFLFNGGNGVYQVAVEDAASSTPTFTLVSVNPGPGSGNNDGTSSLGLPTDLSIAKEGPVAFPTSGGTITYTLTVTNNGPGNSSGFVVNDTIPAPLTNPATTTPGCSVTADEITCLGGRLEAGESVEYTITADVPEGTTAAVDNTATLVPNEEDPTPGNNTSTHTAQPAELSVVKHAGDPVDVNDNGITDAGDTIQFTFDVTNTGGVPLTGVAVNDPLVGDVTCPQDSLAVGATQTCAAGSVYTVTEEDVQNGSVENSATASGTTPDGAQITSVPSTTTTPTTAPAPGISVVKSADLEGGAYRPGQEVTYSFVVTNTGNVPLSGVTVDEAEFSGTGELPAVECPATTLAVAGQMTCETTYTLTAEDVDAGEVTNSATATGIPAGADPVTSTPSEVSVPVTSEPGLSVVKTAGPDEVAAAGQEITYSFAVTNTGNVTLSDVFIDEVDFSGTGELSAIDCPTTSIAAGQVETCTATYTVTQADVDAGGLTNTATAGGTPPNGSDPIISVPSTSTVEIVPAPAMTVTKTANVEAAEVGQELTYSFLITNTGNVTLTEPAVEETDFSGTGQLSPVACPAGAALAPGDEMTCEATYTVTQADVDSGELTNTATVTGTPPSGGDPITSAPSTATVTTDPMPSFSVVKTADVEQVTEAGQVVTYSFVATNTGNVTITDPSVDEVDFTGRGTLTAVTCPDEIVVLAPGESTTCTATYEVVAADLAAGELSNTAVVTGELPDGESITSDASTAVVAVEPPAAPVAGAPENPTEPPALAATGGEIPGPVIGAAALLVLVGGSLVAVRARRQRDAEHLS